MTRTTRRKRIRRRMISTLPTLLTLGNLLCGFAAIFYAGRDPNVRHIFPAFTPLSIAAGFIFVGMVFDALDGRVARMTRNTSDLGEQLDSLADMVCCGVAPAFLIIHLIGIGTPFFGVEPTPGEALARVDTMFDRAVLVVAGLYVACCGLRLARFNAEIDEPEEADHNSFKGMPSPAAAGTVAALVLVHQKLAGDAMISGSQALADAARAVAIGMVALTFLVAIAMVSNIRYVHFANRFLKGRAPFHTIALVVVIGAVTMIEPPITIATLFIAYALSGPVGWLTGRARPQSDETDDDSSEPIPAGDPDS
ncbi:MAG: phosphatidylcholine/phosphatidylserine synthase [Phycisphaeraceae bacterium]|nr:phosphatidylcholine/phosphatidylserine synthase [Phycisphaeraceae bacterium]